MEGRKAKHINSPKDGDTSSTDINTKFWHSKNNCLKSSQCSSVQLGFISFVAHSLTTCVYISFSYVAHNVYYETESFMEKV